MSIFEIFSGAKKRQQVERFLIKVINQIQMKRHLSERRADSRVPATIGVRVYPCTGKSRSPNKEEAFDAATCDMNLGGIAFTNPRQFAQGDALAIVMEFEGQPHAMLAEVRHSTGIGRGIYVTGCAIHEMLDTIPRD